MKTTLMTVFLTATLLAGCDVADTTVNLAGVDTPGATPLPAAAAGAWTADTTTWDLCGIYFPDLISVTLLEDGTYLAHGLTHTGSAEYGFEDFQCDTTGKWSETANGVTMEFGTCMVNADDPRPWTLGRVDLVWVGDQLQGHVVAHPVDSPNGCTYDVALSR